MLLTAAMIDVGNKSLAVLVLMPSLFNVINVLSYESAIDWR